jgi:VanZ family protein
MLIWIGAILSVSSVPGPTLDKVGFSVQDGLAHGLEYAVLGFLTYRRQRLQCRSRVWVALLVASALGALIGAIDETYQLLVPGRISSVADWIADVLGATGGGIVASIYYAVTRRPGRSSEPIDEGSSGSAIRTEEDA